MRYHTMFKFIGSLILLVALVYFTVPESQEVISTVLVFVFVLPCIWLIDVFKGFIAWGNTASGAIFIVGVFLFYKIDSFKSK